MYIAEEFAGRDYTKTPLTEDELGEYKLKLIEVMREKHLTIKKENKKLSEALSSWQGLPES